MKWLLLFLIGLNSITWAQEEDSFDLFESDSTEVDYEELIELQSANIYHVKLETELEKKYFYWLRIRVRDVWPYVLKIQKEYYSISDSAQLIEKKRERKKFIKRRKKELSQQFEEKFKNMSTSRGQVLCKLLYRETNKTVHDMVKELRGGFNAFLWNSAGGAFNIDTKVEFDPKKTREDLFIEVILQKEFASGNLFRFEDADWAIVEQQLNKAKEKESTKKEEKKRS